EIVFNLLSNSIDAAGHGGCIQGSCRSENGCVVAEIQDDGPGIPPPLQEQLFQPFVTTKESGTGLGVYVGGRRVRGLHGGIHCESDPEHGTSFTVKLPVLINGSSPPTETSLRSDPGTVRQSLLQPIGSHDEASDCGR